MCLSVALTTGCGLFFGGIVVRLWTGEIRLYMNNRLPIRPVVTAVVVVALAYRLPLEKPPSEESQCFVNRMKQCL